MNKYKVHIRMGAYFLVSALITFGTLLDSIEYRNFSDLTSLEWLKLGLKSLLPSFVSLKAFLDTTVNTDKPQESEVIQG